MADCNSFIRLCLQHIKADSEHADYYEAVLTLLQHKLSSSMPQPDVATFTSASECLLASSSGVVPNHQLLAQLQQDIWQPMHQALGSDRKILAAYLPAFNHFAGSGASEAFLLILLMAQNGLPGLDADCCFALAVVMENYHREWLCEHVSTTSSSSTAVNVDHGNCPTRRSYTMTNLRQVMSHHDIHKE